jgi:hypothetical protein
MPVLRGVREKEPATASERMGRFPQTVLGLQPMGLRQQQRWIKNKETIDGIRVWDLCLKIGRASEEREDDEIG